MFQFSMCVPLRGDVAVFFVYWICVWTWRCGTVLLDSAHNDSNDMHTRMVKFNGMAKHCKVHCNLHASVHDSMYLKRLVH